MNSDNAVSRMKLQSTYAVRLIKELPQEKDFKIWPRGSILSFVRDNVPVCHFIEQGTLTLERSDRSLLMSTVVAPLALGWVTSISASIILRPCEPCRIATLPRDEVMRLVEQKQLWDVVANHILHITHKLFIHDEFLSSPTTYGMVCFQLMSLMEEEESVRESTAVYQYILDRTRLSRSSVMKMLAELKKGGYIHTEHGKLITINNLPAGF